MYKKITHLPNLDLIRSVAISMVLILHISENFNLSEICFFTKIGKYGVELFFVLSGFLVGSLFFNEYTKNGKVNIKNFILRRISRTLPPYYIVLIPAFLSAHFVKNVDFNFAYLFFLQNFMEEIPYYKVSWSICVEEHFYILLPFILLLLIKIKKKYSRIIVSILILLPLFLRISESKESSFFGYYQTASFFHFDSMILGVIASFFYIYNDIFISLIKKISIFLFTIIVLIFAIFTDDKIFFIYGKFFMSISFMLIILVSSISKQIQISKTQIINKIALSSYAIYLTHPLIINCYNLIIKNKMTSMNIYFQMIILFFVTLIFGYCFYYFVERKILYYRDKYVPKTL